MNYRSDARLQLEAAKTELANPDDARLKYAALSLRMAIEAITYDRALAYKEEFPPDEYETWQPKKVMAVLLEIDAFADADRAISIGKEVQFGVQAPVMGPLGSERVLNMAAIRQHYDALGSFLHLPSIKQMKDGAVVDTVRLRQRCEQLATLIGEVLASSVFNVNFGNFARFDCFGCGKPIRKRVPIEDADTAARCFECPATYMITKTEDGQMDIRAKREDLSCGAANCTGTVRVWEADLQPDKHWTCTVCGGRNHLVLALQYRPPSS